MPVVGRTTTSGPAARIDPTTARRPTAARTSESPMRRRRARGRRAVMEGGSDPQARRGATPRLGGVADPARATGCPGKVARPEVDRADLGGVVVEQPDEPE